MILCIITLRNDINRDIVIRGDAMAQSKAHIKAANKYNSKSYDRLYPFVPKGRKAEIQATADAQGESLNDFIVTAIDERMERLRKK